MLSRLVIVSDPDRTHAPHDLPSIYPAHINPCIPRQCSASPCSPCGSHAVPTQTLAFPYLEGLQRAGCTHPYSILGSQEVTLIHEPSTSQKRSRHPTWGVSGAQWNGNVHRVMQVTPRHPDPCMHAAHSQSRSGIKQGKGRTASLPHPPYHFHSTIIAPSNP